MAGATCAITKAAAAGGKGRRTLDRVDFKSTTDHLLSGNRRRTLSTVAREGEEVQRHFAEWSNLALVTLGIPRNGPDAVFAIDVKTLSNDNYSTSPWV